MIKNIEISSIYLIYLLATVGLAYGAYNIMSVMLIRPRAYPRRKDEKFADERDEKTVLVHSTDNDLTPEKLKMMIEISRSIEKGADIFLMTEYLYMLIFISVFSLVIFFVGEHKLWTGYATVAFIIGGLTSILCGYIGMKIATNCNYRTTYCAYFGIGEAFKTAYHGGCVMGFILVSFSLIVLVSLILIYKRIALNQNSTLLEYRILFESIAGYGLGGSAIALFCRVGGGIYTKAADVGADLVAKLEFGLEEDDPKNPACIADNVGDNVGDIAGMGSDLFGSMAESLCAALIVAATSPELIATKAYYYPLLLIGVGIIVCLVTTMIVFVTSGSVNDYDSLEWSIKLQLIISTVLLIPCIVLLSIYFLPDTYSVGDIGTISYKANVTNYMTMICPLSGLISGLLIGISTEYFTSMTHGPVKELINGCKSGAAINIILGLSLGYLSNIIPTILIAFTIFGSYMVAGMFGIALAAIGMLSNLPVCLAIDGYGPISDNAGGLASMCELSPEIRDITDQLDSAGNTTAAIGKGFAIGSACLVAWALFGAFITRSQLTAVNALTPIFLAMFIFGAMIPYLFTALTMKSVGSAAEAMVQAVREDFMRYNENAAIYKPDSEKCIQIATNNSLNQMFLPGLIVILLPIIVGVLLGPRAVAGLLIGIIISGIQIAISSANSGGAWDNCKKSIKTQGLPVVGKEIYEVEKKDLGNKLKRMENSSNYDMVEADRIRARMAELTEILRRLKEDPTNPDNHKVVYLKGKDSETYKNAEEASIIGDTVGDPLKDTSGPSLNILIKLSSVISVVFASLFLNTSYILK